MTEIEKNEFTTSQFYLKQKEKPPPRGAVLAFLPGFVEIDTLYKHLVDLSNLKAG
jgi:HrpA-like RNA helicase